MKEDEVIMSGPKCPEMTKTQKIFKNFPQEVVEWVNETKKMPNGFALLYSPETHRYMNGMYSDTVPQHFEIIKYSPKIAKSYENFRNGPKPKIVTSLPKGFELKKNGSSVWAEKSGSDECAKYVDKNKTQAKILLGLLAAFVLIGGGILGADKLGIGKKILKK